MRRVIIRDGSLVLLDYETNIIPQVHERVVIDGKNYYVSLVAHDLSAGIVTVWVKS